MPGPAPKHPSTRARRNKTTTAATLTTEHDVQAPALPDLPWHPMTVSWWNDIWASPMAPEYDDSDRHGLFALAMLVNDFWTATDVSARAKIAAEMRMQGVRFGLSPIDRRRLQWEIERAEDAQDRGRKRRPVEPKSRPAGQGDDPRSVLRAV